jgi:hypothetical protein
MSGDAIGAIKRQRELLCSWAHYGGKEKCVKAALCYIMTRQGGSEEYASALWPFRAKFQPLGSEHDSLVRAAALLVAAIEHLKEGEE